MKKKIIYDKRPWGNFKQYTNNEISTIKILTLKAGGKLSKQRHKHREELWIILDNNLEVEINNRKLKPKKGDAIFISKGTIHRLSSKKGGRVLEISFGKFDEKDIERLEDNYGRI